MKITLKIIFFTFLLFFPFVVKAQVTLEKEIKITDLAMYFDGNKVDLNTTTNSSTGYDYVYGTALTPHGDCIKVFGDFVFMTWYRGGKEDRHVMLTRYNQRTGEQKTIEFPHQHTGYNGRWWIGETHNTIAVGISPKNETIHMVYDMHRNGRIAAFANDYLRYSYTTPNAATVPDDEFTIDLFVQSPNNNYKHLQFPGINDENTTKLLTYPAFFTNDEGDLFMKNRFGFSENGKFLFAKYDGEDWEGYTDFNRTSASSYGSPYNWGLYGDIKYVNGKIRIGFQQRANVRDDKYQYQNGFYYAYSDDPSGLTQWKDHLGTGFTRPLAVSETIKISEPGDLVETTAVNQVYMVQGFDWTVTDNEDVHFIGRVKDNENNVTKHVHTYKPAGETDFLTSTDFSGAEAIYAAGDNVYLIGLNSSGRPYIETAPGGTNLFTRVYEQTSGKRFRKGQVYISDGKLYYYLLENNSSDKDDTQPTYLQIIDLNIVTGPQPFAVNLVTPSDNQTFWEGEEIQLYATATADEGEITKVEFLINDAVLQEDTTKPYLLDWIPDSNETYKLKAVAYKTSGESISTSEITIEVKEIDKSDLTIDTYRLRNVATRKFLTDAGGSAIPVTMGDSGEEKNSHWTFVESGSYFNIKSESFGIIRATGSGFENGEKPYFVVSTSKAAPASDTDKVWTYHYDELNEVFRFESKDNNRFLYHNAEDNVTNIEAEETDQRSHWKAIPTSQTLGVTKENLNRSSIKIFPNPARESFSLKLNNIDKVSVKIYNYLGKLVFDKKNIVDNSEININGFSKGIYLVKVIDNNQDTYLSKLIVE